MDTSLVIILAVANVPLYCVFGWVIFGSWGGFLESLKYVLTPDLISLFRGEFWDDRAETFRFMVFLIVCVAAIAGEYLLIKAYF